jgi:malonyl-CoA O-methyltransferase
MGDKTNIDFTVMDGCRPASTDFYDLICANLAAQWFPDLPAVLARLTCLLAPGGLLALSLLGKNTFREWRTAHSQFGLIAGTPAFPAVAEIPAQFPAAGNLRIATGNWIDRPGSGLAFLQGLRALGADTPHGAHTPLSAAQLRSVLRELGSQPAITYELIYACWRQGTP